MNFADRLFAAVQEKESPLVVGIDPDPGLIPRTLFDRPAAGAGAREALARGVQRFAEEIIAAVAAYTCAVKPQLAYFERLGPPGLAAYEATVACARAHGLLVIADGKRNDIAQTAKQYAVAYLGRGDGPRDGDGRPSGAAEPGERGEGAGKEETVEALIAAADREGPKADALTVNGYMGRDTLAPFLESAGSDGGLFVLVKTSNPSSGDLQDRLILGGSGAPGECGEEGTRVAELVGGWLEEHNRRHAGRLGYGNLGAVVGATYPEELASLRRRLPHTPFLIPGFGAQGGTAADVAGGFDARGLGAVVNASRSILYAYRELPGMPLAKAAARKAREARDALAKAAGLA